MSPILIDVDGVLASFESEWVKIYNRVTGNSISPEQLTDWDYMSYLPGADDPRIEKYTHARGFCLDLPEYPGAVDAVKRIAEVADIVFVTSPLGSPYWAHEREKWLEKRFGSDSEIISTRHKRRVPGRMLIDDRPLNIEQWLKAWPDGRGVLFAQTYNLSAVGLHRTGDWKEILELCK